MNVYDFDGTIYEGDSTVDFVKFSLKKYPKCFKPLPLSAILWIGYKLKLVKRDTLKKHLYKLFAEIPDIDAELKLFWEGHEKNVMDWYLKQKKPDDVIISASPIFVVAPMAEKLGVHLIASEVDKKTGALLGPNNHGERKVERFKKEFPDAHVEEFYSDNYVDDPMAKLADRAFLTRHGKKKIW